MAGGRYPRHARELERAIGTDIVLLAEQDEQPVGLAVADAKGEGVGYLHILYVHPSARWSGVAAALLREVVRRLRTEGRTVLELDVLASNERALSVYDRWGFTPVELTLAATVDTLVDRLEGPGYPTGLLNASASRGWREPNKVFRAPGGYGLWVAVYPRAYSSADFDSNS